MAELGFTPDEMISQISQYYLEAYITLAALVLAAYDTILTFSQEVCCIWQRKFTGVTLLYVVIRYGTILNIVLQGIGGIWSFESVSHASLELLPLTACASGPFAKEIGLQFCLCFFSACLHHAFIYISSLGHRHGFCFIMPVVTRAISIGTDLAILGFTLLETANVFKASQSLQVKTSITILIVHNGALQFIAFLVLNTISMTLDTLSVALLSTVASNSSQVLTINSSITSILLSHFLLDLRSIYQSDSNNSNSEPGSTIHFANSIVGNMGATLDAPWTTEDDEDRRLEDQSVTYSHNPFATGLLEAVTLAEENPERNTWRNTETGLLDLHNVPVAALVAAGYIELQDMA
ncbi:unnamed protein product [Somion occarium]|uniref:DUF6533 domain-containing protein n=1 Tax=Somion occarium TaxID=3059160 RepID=A0ABP1CRD6_9APHY